MNRQIDWSSIAVPLDVADIEMGSHYLRRWLAFGQTPQGLSFQCQTADGQPVAVQVDVVAADIVRFRMSQEASDVGACLALEVSDVITSTHHGHGHLIGKGGDPRYMMAELAARSTGDCRGRGGSLHIADFDLEDPCHRCLPPRIQATRWSGGSPRSTRTRLV
jgi:hypothetical protein